MAHKRQDGAEDVALRNTICQRDMSLNDDPDRRLLAQDAQIIAEAGF